MPEFKWKESEKKIASRVYEKARLFELDEIIQKFKRDAAIISDPDQMWTLVDQMRDARTAFERKYEYRYSVLIRVFACLIGEQRITEAELQVLDPEKIAEMLRASDFFATQRNQRKTQM